MTVVVTFPQLEGALCVNTDPERFFPSQGEPTSEARAFCRDCPVRVPCLDWALRTGEEFGIWGGLSPRQRRRLQRGATT